MKILSALFDTALLPLAIAKDVFTLCDYGSDAKSATRKKLEDIEDNICD